MEAERPGEIIHMTLVTTSTLHDGKVVVLINFGKQLPLMPHDRNHLKKTGVKITALSAYP